MKILHVIDSMDMGGGQSLLVELVPVQKELGHNVTVLQLLDSTDRTFIDKLEVSDISVQSLSRRRSIRNIYNIIALIPYLRQYDIIHVHLFPANYWVAIAKLLSFCKTPIVTTEHSTDNKRRKIWAFRYIDAFIYKHYQAVIACADKAKETFEKQFKTIKCLSIPNGVNVKKYTEALPYTKTELAHISEDSFIITMVARFVPSKRQDTIVKAIALLPNNYHAVFVGGDRNDEGLMKVDALAKDLRVEDRVHFLYLRPDVPRILKSSDVVVMSSEYEGLSLSSIEGMACGHPFVASNVDGLREVVVGAGVLVECGNERVLATELQKLCKNKEYNKAITLRCLERASRFDIKEVAKRYLDVYSRFVK